MTNLLSRADNEEHLKKTQPSTCVCDIREWIGDWNQVCQQFEDDGTGVDRCKTCEHREDCHE